MRPPARSDSRAGSVRQFVSAEPTISMPVKRWWTRMSEVDLYHPVKRFLEKQGYSVKGEIGPCDVVAVRGAEGPVVVELKLRLTLALILQAVDRLAVSDVV